MILTRRGWLDYTELQPEDETIGYNPETGYNEWTRIERVIHYPQREVWRFGNKYWAVKCTPNHRWLTEQIVRQPTDAHDQNVLSCPECGATSSTRGPGGQYGAPFPSWRAVQIHRARTHGIYRHRRKVVSGSKRGYVPTIETSAGFTLKALDELKHQDRIVLTRPADLGTALDITVSEAALLGWIAGDGWVSEPKDYWYERPPPPVLPPPDEHAPYGYRRDGQPKKGPGGRPFAAGPIHKVSPLTIDICQAKPEHFAAIDAACSIDPGLSVTDDAPRRKHWKPVRNWRLSAAYSRDLLARAGNPKTEAVSQVLRMSSEQRTAWLAAIIAAEGHRAATKTTVYQDDGPVADAIELAIYLSGNRAARSRDARNGRKSWRIGLAAPYVGGPDRNSFQGPGGHQDVWCVSTILGTWTAKQEGHVFLTGE